MESPPRPLPPALEEAELCPACSGGLEATFFLLLGRRAGRALPPTCGVLSSRARLLSTGQEEAHQGEEEEGAAASPGRHDGFA